MTEPIMSIEEARELLGKDADKMSDEEIEKLICDLDVIARWAIRDYLTLRQTGIDPAHQ